MKRNPVIAGLPECKDRPGAADNARINPARVIITGDK